MSDDLDPAPWIEQARNRYHRDDEVEIDENAILSCGDEEDGSWVSAWVWVYRSDLPSGDLPRRRSASEVEQNAPRATGDRS